VDPLSLALLEVDWSSLDHAYGARSLRLFEHVLVPGLLQTADYARAVPSTRPHTSADEIEELVTARLARQALLARADPPLLYVLLDEGVLHRPVGTSEVMAAQLARLADLSEQTYVTLQVIPYSAGAAHRAAGRVLPSRICPICPVLCSLIR
jgi:Domain of unknown function (DUF5753)